MDRKRTPTVTGTEHRVAPLPLYLGNSVQRLTISFADDVVKAATRIRASLDELDTATLVLVGPWLIHALTSLEQAMAAIERGSDVQQAR